MEYFNVNELNDELRIDPFTYDPKDPVGVFHLKAFIPTVIRKLMEENNNYSSPYVTVTFSDNTTKPIYFKQLILNIILWRILASLRLPITEEDYIEFTNLTESTLSECHTKMYYKCLLPNIDERKVYGLFHESISIFYNFTHEYCWEYATGISLTEMYDLYEKEDIQEIITLDIDNPYDTKLIERTIDNKREQFIDLVVNKYPESCIGPYLVTDTLNKNQIAQLFIAYGPRSDINDKITGKPVLHGTLSGLRNIEEFAVEGLASKKAAIFNRTSVSLASYNSRQGHLTTCEIYSIQQIPCSNNETVRQFIPKGKEKRFIGKYIVEDGKDVLITPFNMKDYSDKFVDMVSVIHCRYPNGLCKRCIGQMADFISSSLHLGLATGSEVFSEIVQKILSSKHTVKTNTINYTLDNIASRWFTKVNNDFFLKPIDETWKIAFPISSVTVFMNFNKWEEMKEHIENESEASHLKEVLIMDNNDNVIEMMNIEQTPIFPYFTKNFMRYLISNKANIKIENNCYIVPLNKWKIKSPLFKIENITYDMTSYVTSVFSFLKNDLSRYNDVSKAIHDFSNIIYEKTEVNIFLVELILRSLVITSPTDYSFPIRNTGDTVYFGKLTKVIDNRALTPKLAFEGLYSSKKNNKFFNNPSNYLRPNSIGIFADFFNL